MVALGVDDKDRLAPQNRLGDQQVKAAGLPRTRGTDNERMPLGVGDRLKDVFFAVAHTVNPGIALLVSNALLDFKVIVT